MPRMFAAWLAHLRGTERWLAHAARFVALHTGAPALFVAAVLVVLGWRILRKSARFVAHVALIFLLFLVASELGWIRW